MEVNRLNQDELTYELTTRGLPVGKVDEMRASLRSALRAEKLGQTLLVIPYPYKFEEDAESLQKKLDEVKGIIESFSGDTCSTEYKKAMTKLEWALSRLGRSEATNEAQTKEKSRLKGEFVLALGSLQEKVEDYQSDSDGSVGSVQHGSKSLILPRTKVPLYKWGIQFSGERDQSLNCFLERITEMCEARGVSRVQLFRSALDLFSGKALIWYRANKAKLGSWTDLVCELKREYLPPDYDDRLLEEIKRRTQGKDESIGTYVAVMTNLFGRLSDPLNETQQLRILKRNVTPFYQSQLGLTDIKTVQDLVELGRRLEAIRTSMESFVFPPNKRNTQLLEPDLAYAEASSNSVATINSSSNNQQASKRFRCFKCGREGHIARFCRSAYHHNNTHRRSSPNCEDCRQYTASNNENVRANFTSTSSADSRTGNQRGVQQ